MTSFSQDSSKNWMSLPRHSQEFRDGVNRFLDYAYSVGNPQGEEILCPCAKCCNFLWGQRESIYSHLICFGFVKGYTRWVNHGESVIGMDVDTGDTGEIYSCDDIEGLLDERFRNVADVEGEKEGMNEDAKKFYNLVDEASKELYPGCKGFSTLSFTIRLYLLKCLHGWSNASFTSLLELLKEAIPNLNLPSSFNKAKAMVRDLGLDYKKIDACPNDCMLYWKEHENETCCHECGTSRWIEPAVVEGDISSKKAHNIPAKTLRHFPLIPRLQRLFMCSKTAKNMSWHQEERKKDGKLRHPADGQSWKDFDNRHSEFAKEPRNLRLGLASDGFNPFRTMSISHSTWPVILMTYNLPPWMCMKQEYFMLSLLIPGPKSPGNDIDVYLQPLIEELKELWELGVETYDAARNKTFQMHAALLWTISDFPAYAMLFGWSTKGKLACPSCNYGTCSSYLTHSRKMCYMGHRVFLPEEHPWRTNKRSFNGKEEHRKAPPLLEGMEVLSHLDSMENSFGKTKKKVNEGPWRKRSIFFDLPYWKYNTSRHNLDVMHIEKNIVDSILGTTPKRKRLVKQYQSNKQFMQKNTAEIHKKQHFISPMMAGGHGQKRVTPMPSKQSTQKEVPISKRMKSMPNQKIGASEEEPENLKKRPTMGMDKFLETHGVHLERENDDFEPSAENERSIQQKQQNLRKTNTKSSCQAMTLDTFLETNGIHVEGEEEHSGANANEVGDDDDDFSDDEDYVGEYEDEVLHGDDNHLMETNNVKDTPKTRRTRGKTRCAKIHARSWEEREEMTFYEGQAVGPTPRRVKDLTYFIGTMGRNSDFITLMYTSWKAVPLKVKKRIWKYINSKFILPKEGKGWVMTGVREAWKGYKTRIKGKHFERYNNIEDMLKNRPLDIPEVQFQKLIAYWSIPSVKALSRLNSENRKKQQHQHRMGPISFARVCNEMREMNENKEDPSQVDVFVATRTGRKGKELDSGTQAVIDKLKSHQEAGDTSEKAFTAVFGKEQPGRVRCYGKTITKTSLQKERKIAKIKQQHAETINSMKTELHETKDRVQSLEDLVKLLLQQSSLGTNIDEALSLLRAKESTHDINSKQCSNGNDRPSSSTRDPK